ncbi:MAG: GerMN domain-containing protein [Deltaproteobacteria bacterium]
MQKHPRIRNVKSLLSVAFIIAALFIGALMLQKYNGRGQQPTGSAQSQPSGTMLISLFFATNDGQGLARETREIDSCGSDLSVCVQNAIEELSNGPIGDLAPTLPAVAIVNSVQVNGETAVIDINQAFANGLPGGSSSETTAVYSIVDTILFNFPRIKRVKFLLEGRTAETLKGHLDLRMPLEADFRLEKKKDAPSPPVQR